MIVCNNCKEPIMSYGAMVIVENGPSVPDQHFHIGCYGGFLFPSDKEVTQNEHDSPETVDGYSHR